MHCNGVIGKRKRIHVVQVEILKILSNNRKYDKTLSFIRVLQPYSVHCKGRDVVGATASKRNLVPLANAEKRKT